MPLPANNLVAGTKAGQDTTGAAIASSAACDGVLVQNDPDNTVDLLVGGSAAQTVQLAPGDSAFFAVSDIAKVFTKTVSGTATVNYVYLKVGP